MKNKILILLFLIVASVSSARDPSKILKDVCKNGNTMKILDFDRKGYEEIDENAFQGCQNVEKIELRRNNWLHIPKNTFKNKGLQKLYTLRIGDGNLPTIDLDLSDLVQLKDVAFYKLKTKIIHTETFTGLSNLETLWIFSNDLFDIDIEGILRYSPKLKTVYLGNNNIECGRLREIFSSGIKFDYYNTKKRDYTLLTVDGLLCLSVDQWNMEIKKNGLEHYSLDCLRGKAHCDEKPENILDTQSKNLTEKIDTVTETAIHNISAVSEKLEKLIERQDSNNVSYIENLNENYNSLNTFMTKFSEQFKTVETKLEDTFSNMNNSDIIASVKDESRRLQTKMENQFKSADQKFEEKIGSIQMSLYESRHLQRKMENQLKYMHDKFEEKIGSIQKSLDEVLKALKHVQMVKQVEVCPKFIESNDCSLE